LEATFQNKSVLFIKPKPMNKITFQTNFAGFRRVFFSLAIFLFCQSAWCALPDFTLTVTKTNETCLGNGSLSFTASGTATGATVTYAIYLLPNTTTPIATVGSNTLGGLTAGNYRVIATQALGSESNNKPQDITITSSIVPLTYLVGGQHTTCGNDGQIIVSVTQGTAVSYEIISGPVIRPLQASPLFDLLPAGSYQVRVFDNCGEGVVQNYVVVGYTAFFNIQPVGNTNPELPSCNTIQVINSLLVPAGNIIAYPLSLEYTIFPPSGSPVIITQTMPGGAPFSGGLSQVIPFFHNQSYSYNVKVTDACGNVYNSNGNVINKHLEVTLTQPPVGCNNKKLVIAASNFVGPFTVNFLAAPAGFNPATYNAGHPGPFMPDATYFNSAVQLLPGNYTVEITDACGRTATASINITFDIPPANVAAFIMMGCEPGQGAVSLISVGTQLQSVIITAAPAGYPNPLPHDVSFNIDSGAFYMNSLPTGSYTFKTVDSCNNERTTVVMVLPYNIIANDVTVLPACNSFGINLHHVDTAIQTQQFWLQKFNTITGQWGHPQTGNPQVGAIGNGNALQLTNNATNLNLPFTGTFRVMITFQVYGNGTATMSDCVKELATFEYTSGPKILAIDSFACSQNASDVVVTATGVGPLIYRITTKDGLTFPIENGNSQFFAALQPATYTFQVEDACGNILNRVFDITTPIALAISPIGLCDGQPGALTLPALPFLNFQWWKGSNTSNILSTSNTLSFPSFNGVSDAGTYHVQITYPNANSCINQVLDFTISPTLNNPQAGTGLPATYCGNQGSIDLFTLLSGAHDNFGTWTELVTNSGALSGNIFDTNAAGPGNYLFKYRVDGLCNIFDETTVDISINAIPETPVAFLEQEVCGSQPLNLMANTIANVTYSWTGPNGFTSSEQNPVINNPTVANNGTYTVKVSANGCDSETSSVEVNVLPTPEFIVQAGCDDNVFTARVIPSGTSFPEGVTYSWTGPEDFAANGNPIILSGYPAGTYSVTVSSSDACPFTAAFDVESTMCTIPKGVSPNEDGDNDTWDLSGFDIDNLKIFNRYGMVIFEKGNYKDEWYGQDKKGHMLPSATYYYLIRLASGEAKSGWVYLLRRQ
jgi:gliding motility-associated-like protein